LFRNLFGSSIHIALTSKSAKVTTDELQAVAAALSIQVARDMAPLWNITATVSAFSGKDKIPHGYWPLTVQDTLSDPTAAGYHDDEHHQPTAYVEYDTDWSVTASHECLEMLADPGGNSLVSGVISGQNVRILRELCDPCEAFDYLINGVKMSDFLTPNYYNPHATSDFSFMNTLAGPLSVAKGGYISYIGPDGNWYQQTWFDDGTAPTLVNLGPSGQRPREMSLREYIDSLVRTTKELA
jgi:hypothetical protein